MHVTNKFKSSMFKITTCTNKLHFIIIVFIRSLHHSGSNNWLPSIKTMTLCLDTSCRGIKLQTFSKTIFWTGQSSTCSSCPLRVLPASSRTLLTIPSESLCTWATFAIGHWLRLVSTFKSTISPITNSLRFLFHFWRDWRFDKNFFHLCQNLLAICWTHLQCLLLNSSALTNSPGGGITKLSLHG